MDRPRLLVVDDDPYTRSALHTLFDRRGWHVLLSGTVAEGLAALELSPRCVLLDLNLPDGGGLDLLRAVRSRHPGTRVAVCSGTDDPALLARVRRLAPELLLCKPVEIAPLLQLCDEAWAASA